MPSAGPPEPNVLRLFRWRGPFLPALLALLLVTPLLGCGSSEEDLLVFAAASLRDALDEVGEQFQETHGVRVRFSYGGSVAMAQQLARGAPADLFLSAGPGPMDVLDRQGLLEPGTRVDLLGNVLVVVAGKEAGEAPAQPQNLLSPGVRRIAVADPQLAPAGAYAREALQSLGLWASLEPKLVMGADVRTVLAYVESGNADVAVVYASDASIAQDLRVLWAFAPETHSSVVYPVAALREAGNPRGARLFREFLLGAETGEVFDRFGFRWLHGE